MTGVVGVQIPGLIIRLKTLPNTEQFLLDKEKNEIRMKLCSVSNITSG